MLAIVTVLTSLPGCHARGDLQGSATNQPVNPLHVVGTILPRSGLEIAQGTRIEIVVRREDSPKTLVTVPVTAPARWPVSFDFAVDWPNLPKRDQKIAWKAGPPDLAVSARGLVDNQPLFIAGSKPYTVEDSIAGRPIELILVPVKE